MSIRFAEALRIALRYVHSKILIPGWTALGFVIRAPFWLVVQPLKFLTKWSDGPQKFAAAISHNIVASTVCGVAGWFIFAGWAYLASPWHESLPQKCGPNRICVILAGLSHDDELGTETDNVRASLERDLGVGGPNPHYQIIVIPRQLFSMPLGGDVEGARLELAERAQTLLRDYGGSVLIYGSVISAKNARDVLELYLVAAGHHHQWGGRFALDNLLTLTNDFRSGLSLTLAVIVTSSHAKNVVQGPSPTNTPPHVEKLNPNLTNESQPGIGDYSPIDDLKQISAQFERLKFSWPINGAVYLRFGRQPDGGWNDGINIAGFIGEPIHAAAAGTVSYVGNELEGYGTVILIKHAGGVVTAYTHCDQVFIVEHDHVAANQIIATVGETGDVLVPQLHFEIRDGTHPINPEAVLGSMQDVGLSRATTWIGAAVDYLIRIAVAETVVFLFFSLPAYRVIRTNNLIVAARQIVVDCFACFGILAILCCVLKVNPLKEWIILELSYLDAFINAFTFALLSAFNCAFCIWFTKIWTAKRLPLPKGPAATKP